MTYIRFCLAFICVVVYIFMVFMQWILLSISINDVQVSTFHVIPYFKS